MYSVLIIDDDEQVQNMLKQTFERSGYKVTTASNGLIGIVMYGIEPFDLVITDLIMPDMDGIETISSLRKGNPAVKIIAISGGGVNNPDNYLYLAKKLGVLKTFTKPVDRDELLGAAKMILS